MDGVKWDGALEYAVPGPAPHNRILEKTLPDGSKIYGWSIDYDYKNIHQFVPKVQ